MLLGWALAAWIGGSFVSCVVADVLLRPVLHDAATRYYLLHAIVNAAVCVLIYDDCVRFLRDPLAGLDGPYSDGALAMTVGLHLFHCASQAKTLTAVDWAHHLVSNMLVSGLCFPFNFGPLQNWACLFVCGLPGGIDYALLFLVKLGKLSKAREKSINRFLNMWIRLPGILSFVPFAYCCHAVGRTSVGPGLLTLQAVLNSVNAIYFADRVVANAATHALKSKEAAAGAKDAYPVKDE